MVLLLHKFISLSCTFLRNSCVIQQNDSITNSVQNLILEKSLFIEQVETYFLGIAYGAEIPLISSIFLNISLRTSNALSFDSYYPKSLLHSSKDEPLTKPFIFFPFTVTSFTFIKLCLSCVEIHNIEKLIPFVRIYPIYPTI